MPKHVRNDEPSIDRRVREGDVAIDMAQGTWVYVVEQAAPDVEVWNRENDGNLLDYAGNWLTGATLGDRVFACVYLGGNGVKSTPSGSYDFPESRLARYPAEEANQDLRRVQTVQVRELLTTLLDEAKRADFTDERDDLGGHGYVGFEDFVSEVAKTALQYEPLAFPDHEDVLAAAAKDADDRFQADRERWEASADQDQAPEQSSDDTASDGGETLQADLGTDAVDDVDDSDLETSTETIATDDEDGDGDETEDDEAAGDDDGLGDFDDFQPDA